MLLQELSDDEGTKKSKKKKKNKKSKKKSEEEAKISAGPNLEKDAEKENLFVNGPKPIN